jgi:hypothetical protein
MRLLARPEQLLLPEEMRGNCAGLAVTLRTHIDRLRELRKQAAKEAEGPPSALFGGRPIADNAARERNRVEALNVVLDAKGCKPLDVDEELKKPPLSPPPTPDNTRRKVFGR